MSEWRPGSDRPPAAAGDEAPELPALRPPEPVRWHSDRLFGPRVEIEIEHGSLVYRLRKTSLGKLILTK